MLQDKEFINGQISHFHYRHRRQFSRDSLDSDVNYSFFIHSIPTILAVLCYISSLQGEFVHDDIFAIKNNGDVTGANSIGQIWLHDYWGDPMDHVASHKSYRPLTTLSFRLDYALGHGDPLWFHVVNVFLHATVTCLLARVLLHVIHTSPLCALLSSCLFAVHPVHTEAVTGIVGRADVLSALFFLLSILLYAKCAECQSVSKDDNHNRIKNNDVTTSRTLYLVTSLLFAVAATLSKETGITVLGVCFLYDVINHRHQLINRATQSTKKQQLGFLGFRLTSLVLTAVAILLTRAWVMDFQLPVFKREDNPASYSDSFLTRALTFNFLLPFNVWLLMCPTVLCYDWQVGSIPLLESLTDARNVFTLLFYLLMCMILRASWRHMKARTSDEADAPAEDDATETGIPVLPMATVLLCLPFLPATNLFFPVGFVVAERVLYIPSIGFCLLVGQGVSKLCFNYPRSKGHVLTFLVIFLMLLGARTWQRNKVWNTRHSLFWSGVQTLPLNAKVHYNVANLCRDTGDNPGAIQHYRRAIKLYPYHASYHNNLATLLPDFKEAESHFQKALSIVPNHKGAMVNLGNLLINHGNITGLTYLELALELNPNYMEALLSLSKAMMTSGQYGQAEAYIKRAIELQPDLADAHTHYGALFQKTGQFEHAIDEYQQAFTLNSHNTGAMKNAATSLQLLGRFSEAEDILKRALALDGDAESYMLLGGLYSKMGHSLEALFAYREAMSLSPNDTVVNLKYIKTLVESNQKSEADQSLTRLLQRNPRDFASLRFAYKYAESNAKMDEALQYAHEALVQARVVKPSAIGSVCFDLANMYREQTDYDNSLKYFHQSIEVDPSLVKAYINMGTIHHLRKNYAEAEKFYLEALSRDTHNEVATNNLRKLRNKGKT